MIEINNVYKSFGSQAVLSGLSLSIKNGETIAIVGPSGTGKSVLLKIITGLLSADSGEVIIDGSSMTGAQSEVERQKLRSRMGVLFQAAALFDSLTLLENVAFPLRYSEKHPDDECIEKSIEYLKRVGLDGYEEALPGEVSIGMRKRVGLARALITNPDLILFDEPNTGLDPETGQEMYELINEVQRELDFTGIVISHEIPEVFQVCDRVAMIFQGKVQEDAEIDDFLSSTKPVVRQFINGDIEGPIKMV